MSHSKIMGQIFKKCNADYNYIKKKYYWKLALIALFLILFFFGFPIIYLEFSPTAYINFCILAIVLIGIVFFIGLFYDETHKIHSIKIINLLIEKLKKDEWNWLEYKLINHIARLHPFVINSEATLYILGHFFLRQGYTDKGELLIERAKSKDPDLEKINLFNALNVKNAQYFYKSLSTDKNLKTTNVYVQLWNKKSIRYPILLGFCFFLSLHFIVQVANI